MILRLTYGKEASGFTMAEMLVLMAIFAVLASIAIPGFRVWLPNYRLKCAARDLYSNLQWVKLSAIRNNRPWAIVFDAGVSPGRYSVCSDPGANGIWDGAGGDDTVVRTVDISHYGSGVEYGHGNATKKASQAGGPITDDISYPSDLVSFTSTGTCRAGYVYLENSRLNTYAIGTFSATGFIRLTKWEGGKWE